MAQGDQVVDSSWELGSAVKLLLKHLAVREAALVAVMRRLREVGEGDLADRFEGQGERRRVAIERLEGELRGVRAIDAKTPATLEAAEAAATIWQSEADLDDKELIPAAARVLGAPGHRGLPSARRVRASSAIRPARDEPAHHWLAPLGYLRAAYQHFRGSSTSTVLSPAVRDLENQTPGPR